MSNQKSQEILFDMFFFKQKGLWTVKLCNCTKKLRSFIQEFEHFFSRFKTVFFVWMLCNRLSYLEIVFLDASFSLQSKSCFYFDFLWKNSRLLEIVFSTFFDHELKLVMFSEKNMELTSLKRNIISSDICVG